MVRPSPTESAQDYPNKIKEGNDGNEYVSRPDKNGIFKWHKIKEANKCKNAYEYFIQFPDYYLTKKLIKYDVSPLEKKLMSIKTELSKHDIHLLKIGWKGIGYFIDNAWLAAETALAKKYKLKNPYDVLDKTNFIFYTDKGLFNASLDGHLNLQWNLNKKSLDIVSDILQKEFKKKYIRPKSKNKTIIIYI